MILKHEPDPLISELGERLLIKLERIDAVKRHDSGTGRIKRSEYVQESAFAAARRSHDGNCIAKRQSERNSR